MLYEVITQFPLIPDLFLKRVSLKISCEPPEQCYIDSRNVINPEIYIIIYLDFRKQYKTEKSPFKRVEIEKSGSTGI